MSTVISKDGTGIAFEVAGRGPALILVDGAFCSRAFGPMPGLASLLTGDFTVYTYDRRGRSESGDTAPYAVQREVEDIEALVDEAGGSAFVYGVSSGAVLALEAANQLPAKVRKLAMYEPPFLVDGTRPPVPADYTAKLKEMITLGRRGDAVEHFMTVAVGLPPEAVAPMRNAPMWPGLEAVAHTLIYDDAILGGNTAGKPLPARQWTSATMPALVMAGGESPASLQNAARAVAEQLPNATRRTLEGQTHEVAAEAIAPALLEFFKG